MDWKQIVIGITVGAILGIGGTFFLLGQRVTKIETELNHLEPDNGSKQVSLPGNVQQNTAGNNSPAIVSGRDVNINYVIRDVITSQNGSLRGLAITRSENIHIEDILVDKNLLPQTKDNRIPAIDEIRGLASKYHLFDRTDSNPHLRFREGDIAYWAEQRLSFWELSIEFYSRLLVLKSADLRDATIPSHGNLSHFSQKIYPTLYRIAQSIWD